MAAKKGIDFRLFPLKSLFIKGIDCVIAQNDGIDREPFSSVLTNMVTMATK